MTDSLSKGPASGAERKAAKKRKKESFTRRIAREGRETVGLMSLLVREPRAFPAALLRKTKRGFRTVWAARGGGLYACGFVLTFVALEVRTFIGEVAAADGVGSFLSEQLLEFVIRFTTESIQNTVTAFLWPVPIIQWDPIWGSAILGALFYLFPRFLKAPLTRWLFDDDAAESS